MDHSIYSSQKNINKFIPIGITRPNFRIKPRIHVRHSIKYEKAVFC